MMRCSTRRRAHTTRSVRWQGVRLGEFTRLGREGPKPHGRARRDRGVVRADPPLEPRDDGIIPLEFMPGETMASLGLTGQDTFTIRGLDKLAPRARLTVEATSPDGKKKSFQVLARVDDPTDLEYVRQGGILQQVLRERIAAS